MFSTPTLDAFAVGTGAVIGALSRFHVGKLATELIAKNPSFNKAAGWHTALINVSGSFVLGLIMGSPVCDSGIITPRFKLFSGIGFCGSFTTFSTYSVDIVTMIQKG